MNERLKAIRLHEDIDLSQSEFGSRIGIQSRAHISALESGTRKITDRIISDVCREFNVNETWLRTGKGPMFNSSPDANFAFFLGKLFREENSFKKRAVTVLSKLTDDQWDLLESLVKEMSKED